MSTIDLFDLYQDLKGRTNIYQGGWWRIQTDFQNSCNVVSNEFWEDYTRKSERSQEYRDNLINFLKSKNILVKSQKSSFGTFEPPKDYGRFASARLIVGGDSQTVPSKDVESGLCDGWKTDEELAEDYYKTVKEIAIENIDNKRWSSVTGHLTKGPTLTNPKLTQIDVGFKVSPREVSVVVLDYYIKPVDAVFAYTIAPGNVQTGAGDQLIYNKGGSKPLQWPETMRGQFLDRLEQMYSQFTRDTTLANLSALNKK